MFSTIRRAGVAGAIVALTLAPAALAASDSATTDVTATAPSMRAPHAATTTVVDCGAGADLQAAIDAASPGDTLLLEGTCIGSFRAVEKVITLEGRGRNPTLAGDPAGTVLIAGDITIKSLTISGGIQGIAVFAGSAGGFTMIHSAVTGNGEGIHAWGGTVDIRESSVSGNGGIGIFNQAVMTLRDSTVSNNAETGIYNRSHLSGRGVLSVVHSTISGNTTSGDGGGIRNEWTLTITDSRIMNNTAAGSGGGIWTWYDDTGMFNMRGAITMRDSKVTGNNAGVDGGGVFLLGGPPSVLQFTDVKIRNNTPNDCVGC
jgi:hypothetical protein